MMTQDEPLDKVGRKPGINDILNNYDVPSFHLAVQVLEKCDISRADFGISITGEFQEIDLAINSDVTDEIRQKNE